MVSIIRKQWVAIKLMFVIVWFYSIQNQERHQNNYYFTSGVHTSFAMLNFKKSIRKTVKIFTGYPFRPSVAITKKKIMPLLLWNETLLSCSVLVTDFQFLVDAATTFLLAMWNPFTFFSPLGLYLSDSWEPKFRWL